MKREPKTTNASWQATKSAETRQRILDSALDVIARQGALSLTIEAVVDQSGITKGGLQYHFPTKEALAFGVLQQSSSLFLKEVTDACGDHPEDDVLWVRSLIVYAFRDDPADIGHWKPLIEMLGYAGEVRALSESFYAEINRRLQGSGMGREASTVMMMALEGYSTSPVELPPGTGSIMREYFLALLASKNLKSENHKSNEQ